jgi:putative SOS response-associated peptidase YedK
MCGRYDLSESPAAIRARFDVPAVPDFAPNADVRPTQQAPVVRLSRDALLRECALLRWGLVPSWSRDPKIGSRLINARAETVDRLPSFRTAYRRRRCLIPVSAFYEWSGPPGKRQKWRIGLADGEAPFGLAGLWEWWSDAPGSALQPQARERERPDRSVAAVPVDAAEGTVIQTFTIVTCAASAAIAPLHDRMPVIVPRAHEAAWLDPATDPQALLVPYGGELRICGA